MCSLACRLVEPPRPDRGRTLHRTILHPHPYTFSVPFVVSSQIRRALRSPSALLNIFTASGCNSVLRITNCHRLARILCLLICAVGARFHPSCDDTRKQRLTWFLLLTNSVDSKGWRKKENKTTSDNNRMEGAKNKRNFYFFI